MCKYHALPHVAIAVLALLALQGGYESQRTIMQEDKCLKKYIF